MNLEQKKNKKPWAHKTLMIGIDNFVVLTPIYNVYWYLDDSYFYHLVVEDCDFNKYIQMLSPQQQSLTPDISEGYEARRFAYCTTSCPNITSPYDNISLSYNTLRVIGINAKIECMNPLTFKFYENDLELFQLGKPQL